MHGHANQPRRSRSERDRPFEAQSRRVETLQFEQHGAALNEGVGAIWNAREGGLETLQSAREISELAQHHAAVEMRFGKIGAARNRPIAGVEGGALRS
jgi:hypothetical protein